MNDIDEIFSTKEVAEKLHTTMPNVRLWIKSGKLKAINVSNGKERPVWKILQSQLDEFLKQSEVKVDG